MKIFKGLFSFFLVSVFMSCISYKYIDIQVLNPGFVKLPSDITIHIIEPQKIDSEYNLSLSDTSLIQLYLYKLLIQNFDSTFKKHLEESPVFGKSRIFLQSESEFHKVMNTIPEIEQKRHVLMSIEKFDVTEKNVVIDYDPWEFDYLASYGFIYRFKIELRNIGTDQFYDTSTLFDTLTWNTRSFYKEFIVNKLPTVSEAIVEIGKIAGERYAEKIAPYWTSEERMLYYSNNRYMRKGYNQFLTNDLEGAIQTWKHLYEAGTPNLASIAAHNIGLVYEMLDDFEKSELWLNNSIKANYHLQTDKYLDRMKERNAGRRNLDEQMVQP